MNKSLKTSGLFCIVFVLLSNHLSSQIEADEWCPKGTWWAYSVQYNLFYKDRIYDLYVYHHDTVINNTPTKVIYKYSNGIEMVLTDSGYLDSINGYWSRGNDIVTIYLQKRGDNIFLRTNDSAILESLPDLSVSYPKYFVKKYIDTNFHFAYKINFSSHEKLLFRDTLAFHCGTSRPFIISDTLINDSIKDYQYNNLQNQSVKMKIFYNHFQQNIYIESNNYLYNMVPQRQFNYAIRSDTANKIITTDSLCRVMLRTESVRTTPRIHEVMCYYQGTSGYLIDNYPRGTYPSGCNYLYENFKKAVSSIHSIEKSTINTYPNPMNTTLHIDIDGNKGTHLVMLNNLGSIVYKTYLREEQNSIDVEHLPKGIFVIYFLNKDNEVISNQKLIKN